MFSFEYLGPIGIGRAREIFQETIGKTISAVEIVAQPSPDKDVAHDELLRLHFTDQTTLTVEIGSNAAQLGGVDASDVHLSFIPRLRAAP